MNHCRRHSGDLMPILLRLRVFLGCIICSLLLLGWNPPALSQTDGHTGQILVTSSPSSQIVVFDKVAVLPLRTATGAIDHDFTELFFQALDKTKKYRLVLQPADHPGTINQEDDQFPDPQALARNFAQAAGYRAVISGRISGSIDENGANEHTTTHLPNHLIIHLTDRQQAEPIWTLTLSMDRTITALDPDRQQWPPLLRLGVEELLRHLVHRGDIYSPRLPSPRIISAQGQGNHARIVIIPHHPSTFPAYQLLRAEADETVFLPVARPIANTTSPLVLEDTDPATGTTARYSIIGLTKNGLASIPSPPLTITIGVAALPANKPNPGKAPLQP
jgi:hypothetical protein